MNASLWPLVDDILRTGITKLSETRDVNAQWLAARCAAATGQPEFSALVFRGLAGHPVGSENCFTGLPLEIVFRSLGPDLLERVLAVPDPATRLRVLNHLNIKLNPEGIALAETIAIQDDALANRLRAFQILFHGNGGGWLKPFLREVRRNGGWSLDLLVVIQFSSQCRLQNWRRRMRRFLQRTSDLAQRLRAQDIWIKYDRDGAITQARVEYEWCRSRVSVPLDQVAKLREYKVLCLRRGAESDPAWGRARLLEDLNLSLVHDLGDFSIALLTRTDRAEIVQRFLEQAIHLDRAGGRRSQTLLKLEPSTAARVIFEALCAAGSFQQDENEKWAVINAVRDLPRLAVIAELCGDHYENPTDHVLPIIIDALMRSIDPGAFQQIPADTQTLYRARLHAWSQRLPPPRQETAHLWSSLGQLLGEVGHEDDAAVVIEWLKEDARRVVHRQAERRAVVEAYIASNRTTAPPGPHDACSYQPIYHQALHGFSGPQVANKIEVLLTDPEELGFAANWLANSVGAPHAETFETGLGKKRFDLVIERRRPREFAKEATPLLSKIKAAIDRELVAQPAGLLRRVGAAFAAVSRLEGATSGSWVLDRLERHFPDQCWDDLLEKMTLVGAFIEGHRVLPFVRRTIEDCRSNLQAGHDQTYRLVSALTTLIYSDAPQLAVEILEGEAAGFLQSHGFPAMLRHIQWAESSAVDKWLSELLTNKSLSPETCSVSAEILLKRATRRGDVSEVVACAAWFVRTSTVQESEYSYGLERLIGEIAAVEPAMRVALLVEGRESPFT